MATKRVLLLAALYAPWAQAEPLTQAYRWHDGVTEHTVYLEPGYVAEYGPAEKSSDEGGAVRSVSPGASLHMSRGKLRVWKLGATLGGARGIPAVNRLRAGAAKGTSFSPVFRPGRSSLGSLMSLPGGIIVHFHADWTESQIHDFVARHHLDAAEKSTIGPNVYVIKTEPGMPSLEKANELHSGGEVLRAMPNWSRGLRPL